MAAGDGSKQEIEYVNNHVSVTHPSSMSSIDDSFVCVKDFIIALHLSLNYC